MFAGTAARYASAVRRPRRYVSPAHHVWVRPSPDRLSPPGPDGRPRPPATYRVELGLTARGLRDVGDVTAVRGARPPAPVKSGAPLLCLDWEGYAVSAADELYHAVWDNAAGSHVVTAPVSGVLREIRALAPEEGVDEADVLAVVISKKEEMERAVGGWVSEEEYDKIVAEEEAEEAEGEREEGTRE